MITPFILCVVLTTSSLVTATESPPHTTQQPKITERYPHTRSKYLKQARDLGWVGNLFSVLSSDYAGYTSAVAGVVTNLEANIPSTGDPTIEFSPVTSIKEMPTPIQEPIPMTMEEATVTVIPQMSPSIITTPEEPADPPAPPAFQATVCKPGQTDCETYIMSPYQCIQLPQDLAYASGSFTFNFIANCYIYKRDHCAPAISHEVQYPGLGSDALAKMGYGSKIRSIKCFPKGVVEDTAGVVGFEVCGGRVSTAFHFPGGGVLVAKI